LAQLDHHAGVLAVACTRDANHNLALTGDRDGVGRIIDLDHLADAVKPLPLSERHKGPITCVAFSPDGEYCATGGEDRAIRLWSTADGKLIQALHSAHKAAVTSLQFAKQKDKPLQLVSAGDNTLAVWDLENIETPKPAFRFPSRSGDVAKLGVSADGQYVLFDHGSEMRVLSLNDREIKGTIKSSTSGASFTTFAAFSPDGDMVLTNSASDGRLQLWQTPGRQANSDPNRAMELRQFVWSGGAATCAAFCPDPSARYVVTGSHDGAVLVWKLPTTAQAEAPPLKATLSLVERALDSGARQVRVWADLDPPKTDADAKLDDLTPGGTATIVVPPAGDAK
jgi:WD40 repeat protein